jgi:hypothetical protein
MKKFDNYTKKEKYFNNDQRNKMKKSYFCGPQTISVLF